MIIARRILLLAAVLAAASPIGPAAARPLKVFAGIPPLAYLAEKIGGEAVEVKTLLPPGRNPHDYEPTPSQLVELARSDLLLTAGVQFEELLVGKLAGGARPKVVDLSAGLPKKPIDRWDSPASPLPSEHAHHNHDHPDPHVWLSPTLLKKLAEACEAALSAAAPQNAADFRRRAAELAVELEAARAGIERLLAPCRGGAFFVFHPAFGYFADEFGLRQIAVEPGGKRPSPARMAQFIRQAKSAGARIIVFEPQFDRRSVDVLAREIGAAVFEADPLRRDIIAGLRELAAALSKELIK